MKCNKRCYEKRREKYKIIGKNLLNKKQDTIYFLFSINFNKKIMNLLIKKCVANKKIIFIIFITERYKMN